MYQCLRCPNLCCTKPPTQVLNVLLLAPQSVFVEMNYFLDCSNLFFLDERNWRSSIQSLRILRLSCCPQRSVKLVLDWCQCHPLRLGEWLYLLQVNQLHYQTKLLPPLTLSVPFYLLYLCWRQNWYQTLSLKRESYRGREKLPSLAGAERSPWVPRSQTVACWPGISFLSCFSLGWLLLVIMLSLQTVFAESQGYHRLKWAVGSS